MHQRDAINSAIAQGRQTCVICAGKIAMRFGFLASAALIAAFVASPVLAADMVAMESPAESAAFNWSGGYVGAQLGYALGNSSADYRDPIVFGVSEMDPDGWLGGLYVGYNYQTPNDVVLGVDADFAFANVGGSGQFHSEYIYPIDGAFDSVDLNWSAAIRGRLGFAVDRYLPYLAAGVAFGGVDHATDDFNPDYVGSYSDTFVGYSLGAGVEYAMTDTLILRGEYRYTDFGSETYSTDVSNGVHDVDLATSDVRIGLAYKF